MAPDRRSPISRLARLALAGAICLAPLGGALAHGSGPGAAGPSKLRPSHRPAAGPARAAPEGAFLASDCRTSRTAIVCRILRCRYGPRPPARHGYRHGHRHTDDRGHFARRCVDSGRDKVYRRYDVPRTGEIYVADPDARVRPSDLPVDRRYRNRY